MSGAAHRIIIRCDATPTTGFGHASRCAALAEALAVLGYRSTFAGSFVKEALARFPAGTSTAADPGSPEALVELARSAQASAIVVDGYAFESDYYAALSPRETGIDLIAIDDFASVRFPPQTLVINFTLRAGELDYPGEDLTVLRGSDYLLVRAALVAARRSARRPSTPARTALVSLGASGSQHAARVAAALRASFDVQITVVGVAWEPDSPAMHVIPAAATLGPALAAADICVLGGGLTKYEAAYLARPSAILSRSSGEEEDTRLLAKLGLIHDLGRLGPLDGALEARVREFATDAEMHRRLGTAAYSFFPADPLSRVGNAVDAHIRTYRERRSSTVFHTGTGPGGSMMLPPMRESQPDG